MKAIFWIWTRFNYLLITWCAFFHARCCLLCSNKLGTITSQDCSTPTISTSEYGSRESLQQWVFIDIKNQSESDNQDISTTDNYGQNIVIIRVVQKNKHCVPHPDTSGFIKLKTSELHNNWGKEQNNLRHFQSNLFSASCSCCHAHPTKMTES